MKSTFLNTVLFLSTILCFVSCSPRLVHYSPGAQSNIGLEEKNDVKANVNLVLPVPLDEKRTYKLRTTDLDLELAWSTVSNLGIFYKTFGYHEINRRIYEINNSDVEHRLALNMRMHEFGIGGYKKLFDLVQLEAYGFLGNGNMNTKIDEEDPATLRYNMTKKGFRTAITLQIPPDNIQEAGIIRHLDVGISYSLFNMQFENIISEMPSYVQDDFNDLYNHPSQLMNQFSIFSKLAFEHVAFKIEYGIMDSRTNSSFALNKGYASLGCTLDLDGIIKGIKEGF